MWKVPNYRACLILIRPSEVIGHLNNYNLTQNLKKISLLIKSKGNRDINGHKHKNAYV